MTSRFFGWIDALHNRKWTIWAIWGLRILLALGFILGGLRKVDGSRFHNPDILTLDTEIGFFFEAMYRTGLYWRFLGWAQVVAGALLLIPRTALLGALCYLPIITNIVVITYSMYFAGTPVITTLMWLGCVALLVWDYRRLRPILFPRANTTEY